MSAPIFALGVALIGAASFIEWHFFHQYGRDGLNRAERWAIVRSYRHEFGETPDHRTIQNMGARMWGRRIISRRARGRVPSE